MPAPVHGYLGVVRRNNEVGSLFPVRQGECVIGRAVDCDVRIHLESVSERQCVILSRPNKESTIRNLSPTSETFVNGRSLGSKTALLTQGDVVRMSERCLRWEYPTTSKFWRSVPSKGSKVPVMRTLRTAKKGPAVRAAPVEQLPPRVHGDVSKRSLPACPFKPSSNSLDKGSSLRRGTRSSSPTVVASSVRNVPKAPVLNKVPSQKRPSVQKLSQPSLEKNKLPSLSAGFHPSPSQNSASRAKANAEVLPQDPKVTNTSLQPKRAAKKKEPATLRSPSKEPVPRPVLAASLDPKTSTSRKKKPAALTVYGYLTVERQTGFSKSRLPVHKATCTIGRGMDSTMRIALATISDKHCVITSHRHKESTIKNVSPTACTAVNGTSLGDGTAVLRHHDTISLGERSFLWEYPAESPFATASPGDASPRAADEFDRGEETDADKNGTFAEECSRYLMRQATIDKAAGKAPTYISPKMTSEFKTWATNKGLLTPDSPPRSLKNSSPLTKVSHKGVGNRNLSPDLPKPPRFKGPAKKAVRLSSIVSSPESLKNVSPAKSSPSKRSRLTSTRSRHEPSPLATTTGKAKSTAKEISPTTTSNNESTNSLLSASSGSPRQSSIIDASLFKGFCIKSG